MPTKKSAVKLYVSGDEHTGIITKACQCGLSVSEFGKRVCLGYPVKSMIDQEAIREVARVGGNLGRLGGLLKMWLINDDEYAQDVRELLDQVKECQAELRQTVAKL
ncbi:MAG: conjugal transfer protein TraJ [Pseudodesulfovibrio sp.]|nr:conjugal transfer protein TraJ [Pseudodesulfovibrio sp.]